jgi:hypothetical protein
MKKPKHCTLLVVLVTLLLRLIILQGAEWMEEIKIVLIAAPEFPTDVSKRLTEELPHLLEEQINENVRWTLETITDGFTSVAENEEQLLDGVLNILETEDWDYAISLTDIPFFYEKEVLITRVNYDYKFGLVSLPAFGWFMENRVTDMVLQVIDNIYHDDVDEAVDEPDNRVDDIFKIGNIDRVRYTIRDTTELRYVFSFRPLGLLTILLGMTYDNKPWRIMSSLKTTIAVAFGSGAYAIVFPTLWQISYAYTNIRLSIIMILATVGMGAWIIQGHDLWEKKTSFEDNRYRNLYNAATLSTMFLAILVFYLVLFGLFFLTTLIFVEPSFYAEQVGIDQLPHLGNYLHLSWIAASVGTITGAIGVGLEDEENVRQTTYGYRQRERYRLLEEEEEEHNEEAH